MAEEVDSMRLHCQASEYGRNLYRDMQKQAQAEWSQSLQNSISIQITHISIGFYHCLEYPHRARERMDEYFTPKVSTHVLGIVNEGSGVQYNYLFHEPGKCDPSAVVSMLHDFFQNEEPSAWRAELLVINADSCSAQNKNNTMVSYLKSRIANSFHNRILLRFLLKGHTRFSVDSGFGNNRTMLARHDVASLKQISAF